MKTLWKIYFAIFAVLVVCGYAIEFFHIQSSKALIVTVADLLISLPAFAIFYGFISNENFFSSGFRKVYVICFLAWEIVANLFLFSFAYGFPQSLTLPDLIIYLPEYIAMIMYAFFDKRLA